MKNLRHILASEGLTASPVDPVSLILSALGDAAYLAEQLASAYEDSGVNSELPALMETSLRALQRKISVRPERGLGKLLAAAETSIKEVLAEAEEQGWNDPREQGSAYQAWREARTSWNTYQKAH